MAKIPLKAYHREIEGQIERGEYEQAVAHCKHILEQYPKSIDTYRLLGKSYLESQRFVDASDIFQRVLSAVPDDFVSHVGMSIIREDEGNLDDSIWHMQRAFEVQPANAAIQGELRRLIGRRDGIEPPKINLTRAALARMYIKGGLYQQAIAELRIALGEDAQRPDLQVLLAKAYALANQKVEAIELCNNLMTRFPYCLEASRILGELLVHTDREMEVETFKARYRSLNPYAAFISESNPQVEQVPDAAVNVEKLDWQPGQPFAVQAGQPEWASNLGLHIESEKPAADGLPNWLVAAEDTPQPSSVEDQSPPAEPEGPLTTLEWNTENDAALFQEPADESDAPAAESSPDNLPEWMKEAGWEPSSGEANIPTLSEAIPFGEENPELTPSDIPEWMRSLAPEETASGEINPPSGSPVTPTAEESLPWLEEAPATPGDSVITWLQGLDTEQPAATPAPQPASSEEALGLPETAPDLAKAELPDWLKELEKPGEPAATVGVIPETAPLEEPTVPQPVLELPQEPSDSGIPDWLKETLQTPEPGAETLQVLSKHPSPVVTGKTQPVSTPAAAEPEPGGETDIMAWLKSLDDSSTPVTPTSQLEETGVHPMTEAPAAEASLPEMPSEGAPLTEDENDAAFAWLENLAARQGAEEALLLQPEERLDEPPDWVKRAAEEGEPTSSETAAPEPPPELTISAFEELVTPGEQTNLVEPVVREASEIPVEPMTELGFQAREEEVAAPEIPPAGSGLTEWLRELQGVEMPADTPSESDEPEEPLMSEVELPDWMTPRETELAQQAPKPEQAVESTDAAPAPQVEEQVLPSFEAPAAPPPFVEVASETPASEVTAPDLPTIPPPGIKTPVEEPQVAAPEPLPQPVPLDEFGEKLNLARQHLQAGKPADAYPVFDGLIRARERLEEVVAELNQALYRFPMDVQLWQYLGDAYMRTQQLKEALEAYTKAEELLR